MKIALEQPVARLFGIKSHPGWHGEFTTRSAIGAYPNGSRVVKIACDPAGDENENGSVGRVLGSIQWDTSPIMYFVEWDHRPRHAFCVHAGKLEKLP